MTLNQNSAHQEIVILWEQKNIINLSPDQTIQVFENAFQALERRCLGTLSNVTVQVVLDRIIHQGKEKFPILKKVLLEANGLNFTSIKQKKDEYNLSDINNAFIYLLIELLTVIGHITSEVLTAPLHKELMKVTRDNALMVHKVQNLRSMVAVKKRCGK